MVDRGALHTFLSEWSMLTTDVSLDIKLLNFIDSWKAFAKPIIPSPTQITEVDIAAFQSFTNCISPMLDAVKVEKRNGESVNVWEVAGIGHDEVRVSSVLAWFMNCHAEHGQSNSILTAIIDALPNKPPEFPASEKIRAKSYWVNVESCASGERSSRIDIEIGGEAFLLFIEVKVHAGETGNQLERYLQIARTKAGGRPWGIIYLTPEGKNTSVQDPLLLPLSWQIVANTLDGYSKSLPDTSYSRRLISQFSKHVTTFRR